MNQGSMNQKDNCSKAKNNQTDDGINARLAQFQNGFDIVSLKPPFPRLLSIDTTNACNYSCIFCPKSKLPKMNDVMDYTLFKNIVSEAFDLECEEVGLSIYSKPLMNVNIDKYVAFCKSVGYTYVYFTTNGSLLTTEKAEKLIDAGLDSIRVSVNSTKEKYSLIHGTPSNDYYDRVIKNIIEFDRIRKEKKSKCKLYVSITTIKNTLEDVESIKKTLQPYTDEFVVCGANNRGGTIGEAEILFQTEGKLTYGYPCFPLFNKIDVSVEGYVVTCCIDFQNMTVMADLKQSTLKEAWECENFVNYRKNTLIMILKGHFVKTAIQANTIQSFLLLQMLFTINMMKSGYKN
jgi:MoaA/NifB/PqqE/SkfB family radical SAM enzyme